MVDVIAKLTKRRSRALQVQVGNPGILGRAQLLMGMAEGLCVKGPRGAPPSSGLPRRWVSRGELPRLGELLPSILFPFPRPRLSVRGCRGALRDGGQLGGREAGQPPACGPGAGTGDKGSAGGVGQLGVVRTRAPLGSVLRPEVGDHFPFPTRGPLVAVVFVGLGLRICQCPRRGPVARL